MNANKAGDGLVCRRERINAKAQRREDAKGRRGFLTTDFMEGGAGRNYKLEIGRNFRLTLVFFSGRARMGNSGFGWPWDWAYMNLEWECGGDGGRKESGRSDGTRVFLLAGAGGGVYVSGRGVEGELPGAGDFMNEEKLSTDQKALQINMDAKRYGTFAEIGAGQEVARRFFHVGGAAGTVAKTISAYDMGVSDAIYGPCDRYVSSKRLQSMLDYEFNLLLERLNAKRGAKCNFFSFADTVATHSYTRHEEGQGWMGIRFQTECGSEASEIIIHVHMLDQENVREQEALGIIGVNLMHGAFYHFHEPEVMIGALMDDLTRERIEVDMIRVSGPAFAGVDNRLLSLQLVQQGLADAAMFTADGEVVQPADILYKKPVLIERGSFRPITNTTLDMLERAHEQFLVEPEVKGRSRWCSWR